MSLLGWWRRMRRPRGKQLRAEREHAESRAEVVQREVVEPLQQTRNRMRSHNHVYEAVKRSITEG